MTENQQANVILFADIVGSTSLYETLGNAAAKQAVDRVLDMISEIARRRGGTIIKYIGDEMLARFPDPDEACIASVEMQEITIDKKRELHELTIKVGMDYGPVILDGDDVFGNTVNVAARMASVAVGGQIITTDDLLNQLNSVNKAMGKVFDRTRVRGRSEAINLVMLVWEDGEDVTTVAGKGLTETKVSKERLVLSVGGDEYSVDTTQAFTIGRGITCDLAIPGALLASRTHARIEFKRGKFVLIDQSTNGTWVRTAEGDLVTLRRDELKLFGEGVFCLGSEFEDDSDCHVYYRQ